MGPTGSGSGSVGRALGRHVRAGPVATSCLRSIMHGHGLVGLGRVRLVLLRVRARRHVLGAGVVSSAILLAVAIPSARRLGAVRHNLQTPGNSTGRRSAPGGIGGSGGATEALLKLLKQGAANVVGGNVNGVGNAHDNERPFRREGKARVGRIKSST